MGNFESAIITPLISASCVQHFANHLACLEQLERANTLGICMLSFIDSW